MNGVEIVDLVTSSEKSTVRQCEVCVIGAGAAGIYLAVELVSRGLDVLLIEAGDITCTDGAAIGFDARFDAELYPAAVTGRLFGLGGSTSRWGGLLIPHSRHDVRGNGTLEFDVWSHIVQTINDKIAHVLDKLGWRDGNDFSDFALHQLKESGEALHVAGLDVVAGLFLPFRKKNFTRLLKRKSNREARLRISYNTVVNSLQATPDANGARIQQAQAVAHNGNRLTISAQRFIVAAGAIESARILLEMDKSSPLSLIREGSATGCYLADHLSLPIADVAAGNIEATIKSFAPRFSNGWMRSFRFLESNPPADAPRAFSHFIFDNKNPGFVLAKEVLGALQGRRWPHISMIDVASGLYGIAQLGYNRFARSVLYIPPDTNIHLQLDIEQIPVRENSIKLGNELDRYSRPIAKIYWRISDRDVENIRKTAQRFLEKWPGERFPFPKLLPRVDACDARKPHDAYHPVGTCRMGRDSEAVVDMNLKVWGLENLWVVSTGVLPSAGTANPTLTMLCLAENLADHLESKEH